MLVQSKVGIVYYKVLDAAERHFRTEQRRIIIMIGKSVVRTTTISSLEEEQHRRQ
jgi:hypothetical protein